MGKKLKKILARFNQKEKLCASCIFGRETKNGVIVCGKEKKVLDFQFYCDNFKLYKKSNYRYSNMLYENRLYIRKDKLYNYSNTGTFLNSGLIVLFIIPLFLFNFIFWMNTSQMPTEISVGVIFFDILIASIFIIVALFVLF